MSSNVTIILSNQNMAGLLFRLFEILFCRTGKKSIFAAGKIEVL